MSVLCLYIFTQVKIPSFIICIYLFEIKDIVLYMSIKGYGNCIYMYVIIRYKLCYTYKYIVTHVQYDVFNYSSFPSKGNVLEQVFVPLQSGVDGVLQFHPELLMGRDYFAIYVIVSLIASGGHRM